MVGVEAELSQFRSRCRVVDGPRDSDPVLCQHRRLSLSMWITQELAGWLVSTSAPTTLSPHYDHLELPQQIPCLAKERPESRARCPIVAPFNHHDIQRGWIRMVGVSIRTSTATGISIPNLVHESSHQAVCYRSPPEMRPQLARSPPGATSGVHKQRLRAKAQAGGHHVAA